MIPGIIIGVILTLTVIGVRLLLEPAQREPDPGPTRSEVVGSLYDWRISEPKLTKPSPETLAMLAILTAKWPPKVTISFPTPDVRAIDLCTCHHDRSIHYLTGDRLIQFECSDPNCTCKNFMPVPYIEESNERPRVMSTIQERLEEAVPEFIEEVETYRIVLPHPNPNEIQRAFWGLATPGPGEERKP